MIHFECLCEDYILTEDINTMIEAIVERSIRELKRKHTVDIDVSIYLIDDDEMKEINNGQRGINQSTDVLSFPINDFVQGELQGEGMDIDPETGDLMLGDIMISIPKCIAQSKEYQHSFERELAFLITHGLFHLMGYDHGDKQEEKVMMRLQEEVLADLNISRERKGDNEF